MKHSAHWSGCPALQVGNESSTQEAVCVHSEDMPRKAEPASHHCSYEVELWTRCGFSVVFSRDDGETAAVESIYRFNYTLCEAPCLTAMCEGGADT